MLCVGWLKRPHPTDRPTDRPSRVIIPRVSQSVNQSCTTTHCSLNLDILDLEQESTNEQTNSTHKIQSLKMFEKLTHYTEFNITTICVAITAILVVTFILHKINKAAAEKAASAREAKAVPDRHTSLGATKPACSVMLMPLIEILVDGIHLR